MKDTDQTRPATAVIAAEAERIMWLGDNDKDRDQRRSCIKSAIEKGIEHAVAMNSDFIKGVRAAHSSPAEVRASEPPQSRGEQGAELLAAVDALDGHAEIEYPLAIKLANAANAYRAALSQRPAAHASEPTCEEKYAKLVESRAAHASELQECLEQGKGGPPQRAARMSEQLGQGDRDTGNSDDTELTRCRKACQEQAQIIAGLHQKLATHPDFPKQQPAHASERGADFWKEMFIRAQHGCFTKDCVTHGAFSTQDVERVGAALSQHPTPDTANEHDKTCICMYCKPELWPDDSEENKYRDLAAERWNLYHELLMAVENKYEGESRHETALRLIREAQKSDISTNQEEA